MIIPSWCSPGKHGGTDGLLEACAKAILNPGIDNGELESNTDDTDDDGEDLKEVHKQYDFKDTAFQGLAAVATDGESANTGTKSGLWRKLSDALDRLLFCTWCACHRSDFPLHDL